MACASGDLNTVLSLLDDVATANFDASATSTDNGDDDDDNHANNTPSGLLLSPRHLLASTQNNDTGLSPLMVATRAGNMEICHALLDAGAPWNALDRDGRCAGDHAVECERWDVVNLLVDVGTKAELILGASICLARRSLKGDDNAF